MLGGTAFLLARASASPSCRCRAPEPCFAAVPFAELNASVHGRLVPVLDEMHACVASVGSAASALLNLSSLVSSALLSDLHDGGQVHPGFSKAQGVTTCNHICNHSCNHICNHIRST